MRTLPQRAPDVVVKPGVPSNKRVFWYIVALCATTRIVLHLYGARSTGLAVSDFDFWNRWDAEHYLKIAAQGYVPNGHDSILIVFFPLYPALVHYLGFIFRDLLATGLLLSFAASVGAYWFLYRLIRLDHDHALAWRALILLTVFPTAYFMSAPYTESLFLLTTTACMYAARTCSWKRAGLAGAAATASRIAGITLLPALAVEVWIRKERRIGRLIWLGLVPTGLLLYFLINYAVFKNPLYFLDIQKSYWSNGGAWPWKPFPEAFGRLRLGGLSPDDTTIFAGRLLALTFGLGLLVAGWKRLRPSELVYGWASLLFVSAGAWLISLPRYVLGIYPLFVVLASYTRRRVVYWPVVAGFTAVQLFLYLRFVRGIWTF